MKESHPSSDFLDSVQGSQGAAAISVKRPVIGKEWYFIHLANVLASVSMGPSGPESHMANDGVRTTCRFQEGSRGLWVSRSKLSCLGGH